MPLSAGELRLLYDHIYWYVIAALFGILLVFRGFTCIANKTYESRNVNNGNDPESSSPSRRGRSNIVVRIFDAVNSFFVRYLYQPFGLVISATRMKVLAAGVLVAYNVVFLLVYNLNLGTVNKGLSGIGNRAGHLVAANLPLLFVLVGRNNLVSMVTGIPYKEFNYLHRVIGTVCLLYGTLHAALWITYIARKGSAKIQFDTDYVRWGYVCIASFLLFLALPSVSFLRRRFYDIFLWMHVLGSLIFLIGILNHWPDLSQFMWPAVAFWGFDRLVRIVRLLLLHLVLPLAKSGRPGLLYARVELRPGAIILHVPYPTSWAAPGHVYVNFFDLHLLSRRPILWGQWHPFSISNVSDLTRMREDDIVRDGKSVQIENRWDEMLLVLRVKSGMTRHLESALRVRRATLGSDKPLITPILLEGPYTLGHTSSGVFDSILLVAGGSGVTHCLAVLGEAVKRELAKGKGSINVRSPVRITLAWVVKDLVHALWVSETLSEILDLAADQESVDVQVQVFVTSGSSGSASSMARDSTEGKSLSDKDPDRKGDEAAGEIEDSSAALRSFLKRHEDTIRIMIGRPDVDAVVSATAQQETGRTGIFVCGPTPLADSIRAAAGRHSASPKGILKGSSTNGGRIQVFVESFD